MTGIAGTWRITWMETWPRDFVDLVEPGYFRFDEDRLGNLAFGTVRGDIDYRVSDNQTRVDFSWHGDDDGRPMSGRGWFTLSSANRAKGRLFIHRGDESAVELEKQE